MSKELEALKYLKENKRKHWLDDDKSTECLDTIENALLTHEKLCKVINNFYEMVHGKDGVRYKFDSEALAHFSYKLKCFVNGLEIDKELEDEK